MVNTGWQEFTYLKGIVPERTPVENVTNNLRQRIEHTFIFLQQKLSLACENRSKIDYDIFDQKDKMESHFENPV